MIDHGFYWQLVYIYLGLLGVPVLLALPILGLVVLGRGIQQCWPFRHTPRKEVV